MASEAAVPFRQWDAATIGMCPDTSVDGAPPRVVRDLALPADGPAPAPLAADVAASFAVALFDGRRQNSRRNDRNFKFTALAQLH
jgi:hypothetical protein